MSRPDKTIFRALDDILAGFDVSHDFGRREAYEASIDYARKNLIDHPQRDEFVAQAAKRLGFVATSFDAILARRRLTRGTWLDVWISDIDEEVAVTGTREGIQYLIDLLVRLRDSDSSGEHFHLDRGAIPMTDVSANLILFKEDESWFTDEDTTGSFEPYPQREIDPANVHALQIIHFPPEDYPLSANRLYRVIDVGPGDPNDDRCKELPGGDPSRYFKFRFTGDEGEPTEFTFHLDDPGLNFFTHREIMGLALKSID